MEGGRIRAITHEDGFSGNIVASPVLSTFQHTLIFPSVYRTRELRKLDALEEKWDGEGAVSLRCKQTSWVSRRQIP